MRQWHFANLNIFLALGRRAATVASVPASLLVATDNPVPSSALLTEKACCLCAHCSLVPCRTSDRARDLIPVTQQSLLQDAQLDDMPFLWYDPQTCNLAHSSYFFSPLFIGTDPGMLPGSKYPCGSQVREHLRIRLLAERGSQITTFC